MPGAAAWHGVPPGESRLPHRHLRHARGRGLLRQTLAHRHRGGAGRRGRGAMGVAALLRHSRSPRRLVCWGAHSRSSHRRREGGGGVREPGVPVRRAGVGAVRAAPQAVPAVAEAEAVRDGHHGRLHERQAAREQAQMRGRARGDAPRRGRRALRHGSAALRPANGGFHLHFRRQLAPRHPRLPRILRAFVIFFVQFFFTKKLKAGPHQTKLAFQTLNRRFVKKQVVAFSSVCKSKSRFFDFLRPLFWSMFALERPGHTKLSVL